MLPFAAHTGPYRPSEPAEFGPLRADVAPRAGQIPDVCDADADADTKLQPRLAVVRREAPWRRVC